MPTTAQINTMVAAAAAAAEAAPATNGRAGELVDFIQACVTNGVDLVGPGFEGLTIRGGQVWFHSLDGKPTGVPTAARIKSALDVEAARRLHAALLAKFNP